MLAALADAGFDIAHAFDARAISDLVDTPRATAVLVGHTRALWPHVRAAASAGEPDPIDTYASRVITAASAPPIHFAHRQPFLPFQRIAERAGLAALAPCRLLIHPTYGPWFALRALIFADAPPPPLAAPPAIAEVPAMTAAFAHAQRAGADDWRAWLAIRDACPIGREYRYSAEQIHYHYTRGKLGPR